MNIEHRVADGNLSRTPPNQSLPPTPPRSGERKQSIVINSVEELRRYWNDQKADYLRWRLNDDSDEVIWIQKGKEFNPLEHLEEIRKIFRRFDCYPTTIRVRMPSSIHGVVIGALVEEYGSLKDRQGGEFLDIYSSVSSDVPLDNQRETRQPDVQLRHRLQKCPRVIMEVAYTQTEKALERLAWDYILKSNGYIKRVYGINLQPIGKPSRVIEWCARVTLSNEADYDEEVRVEKTLFKV